MVCGSGLTHLLERRADQARDMGNIAMWFSRDTSWQTRQANWVFLYGHVYIGYPRSLQLIVSLSLKLGLYDRGSGALAEIQGTTG